jgi:hypothetical protein
MSEERFAPMSYAQAEVRMTEMAKRIRAIEVEYGQAMDEAADAEALYRKSLADKYRSYRDAGKTVDESNTLARGDCWNLSRERDRAMGAARRRVEELEDRRGERVSLHRLVEWSTAIALMDKGVHADREEGPVAVPG